MDRAKTRIAIIGAVMIAGGGEMARAQAPVICSFGRNLSGTCANGALTGAMQQRAVVFTQSKISYLGVPLPSTAGAYVDAARDRQSLAFGVDRPVVTTPITTPPPGTFIGLPANVNPTSLNIAAPFTVVPGGIRLK